MHSFPLSVPHRQIQATSMQSQVERSSSFEYGPGSNLKPPYAGDVSGDNRAATEPGSLDNELAVLRINEDEPRACGDVGRRDCEIHRIADGLEMTDPVRECGEEADRILGLGGGILGALLKLVHVPGKNLKSEWYLNEALSLTPARLPRLISLAPIPCTDKERDRNGCWGM